MVQGNQLILDIGSGSHLCSRTQQESHVSASYLTEQFCFFQFRIGLMDKSDFLVGNPFFFQLSADIIINIEAFISLGRGKIAEDQLG